MQRRIIDFAYRVDKELASSLVALADRDPARIMERERLREHVRILEARKSLPGTTTTELPDKKRHKRSRQAKAASPADGPPAIDAGDLPQVAWRSLASLHAGRSVTLSPKDLRKEISTAAEMPLSEAYPVLVWALANVTKLYSDTDQASTVIRPVYESTILACQVLTRLLKRSADQSVHVSAKAPNALAIGCGVVIGPGERDTGLRHMKQWMAEEVTEYLLICDPYFSNEDLAVLKLVLETKPNIAVRILADLNMQEQQDASLHASYLSAWAQILNGTEPPDTEICLIRTRDSHRFPIHDRWWLSRQSGLRCGTSFNSLGMAKKSELSLMTEFEVNQRTGEVLAYLNRSRKEFEGEKLEYIVFTL